MKKLPSGLEAHLKSGATTLCWCWRLTRRDGVRLGFTDHDRALTFDGTTFEAEAGLDAGDMSAGIGLSVDNLEIGGAVTSTRLAEGDLGNGLYDDAKVEIYRVNWRAPAERVLMRAGSLGEVKRAGKAFAAEIRGMSHYLQQPKGRLFQYACDTDLGSAACGIDLNARKFRATGRVDVIGSQRAFGVALSGAYAAGWFARGLMTLTTGAAAGFASEVRAHVNKDGRAWLTVWQAPVAGVVIGDGVVVTAGCDKQFATCRDRFDNAVNFRGFPHMPGNDVVTSYIRGNKT